jgi:hypothetical protein
MVFDFWLSSDVVEKHGGFLDDSRGKSGIVLRWGDFL